MVFYQELLVNRVFHIGGLRESEQMPGVASPSATQSGSDPLKQLSTNKQQATKLAFSVAFKRCFLIMIYLVRKLLRLTSLPTHEILRHVRI